MQYIGFHKSRMKSYSLLHLSHSVMELPPNVMERGRGCCAGSVLLLKYYLLLHESRMMSRVAYRIFLWGGHTLVRPLGGLVACSPRKLFVFYVGLCPNSGGGELKLEGGNPSAPPPPPTVCNPDE